MEWIYVINKAIKYVEENIEEQMTIDDVANYVNYSSAHFQRLFNLTTGLTIGEYIRNRRLSLAGIDLLKKNSQVTDIAFKYQYETLESFSKAFYRFHGINPGSVKKQKDNLKFFNPLIINISIEGGFNIKNSFIDNFCWNNFKDNKETSARLKYQKVCEWALKARIQNSTMFDTVIEWLLDDSEWSSLEKINENEQIFMNGFIARFRKQNMQLRAYLKELEPFGVVNTVVYKALNKFDELLSGIVEESEVSQKIVKMFADFSIMKDHSIRKQIAGGKSGPEGVETVDIFGYINMLKEADSAVQWTLFMPDFVKRQLKGFEVEKFEYVKMDAFTFIGFEGEEYQDQNRRLTKMKVLEEMTPYHTNFNYDLFLMHHNGLNVDVPHAWHGIWGRICKKNTPVPDGFISMEFVPVADKTRGLPYISQFALAKFSGDLVAMHSHEGYDMNAMYDVTRNIVLAQNVCIPYPEKYWTAEVFFNGCDKDSTGYMFGVIKEEN